MAKKLSAGILLYRRRQEGLQVFLVHPGGPFWAKKDEGAWSIPKGMYQETEDALAAAKREFHEETGSEVNGPFRALSPLKQPSGKVLSVWAAEGDLDEILERVIDYWSPELPPLGPAAEAPFWHEPGGLFVH